jgi:predicted HD phosphohydrolase
MSEPDRLDLVRLFAEAGRRAYGESITQLEHALQCAALARHDRADDEIVVAALLHDVGHLVEDETDRPNTITEEAAPRSSIRSSRRGSPGSSSIT